MTTNRETNQAVDAATWNDYPQQLRHSTEQPAALYVQQPNLYAVHGSPPTGDALLAFPEDEVAVYSATQPMGIAAESQMSPVYALRSSASGASPTATPTDSGTNSEMNPGAIAVPTGQLFVRFATSTTVDAHQAEIEAAGYQIVDRPPPPYAAWVTARSGQIEDALRQIPKLEAIAGMENVEPQMLMQRSQR